VFSGFLITSILHREFQQGDFSKRLLTDWKGHKLYLVDSWRQLPNYDDCSNVDPEKQMMNMARAFYQTYEFGDRVAMIRDLSVNAARMFEDHSLDFVYLDADHSYEGVVQDILAWSGKVRPGGLLCGDDYLDNRHHTYGNFGVKSAVDEFALKIGKSVDFTNDEFPNWFLKI
jgi:hypothetical protein